MSVVVCRNKKVLRPQRLNVERSTHSCLGTVIGTWYEEEEEEEEEDLLYSHGAAT